MEDIYERLLFVGCVVLGVLLAPIVNGIANWFERMRPGKRLEAMHQTLNHIAAQMEKLEAVLSQETQQHPPQKNKAAPPSVKKHINGAA